MPRVERDPVSSVDGGGAAALEVVDEYVGALSWGVRGDNDLDWAALVLPGVRFGTHCGVTHLNVVDEWAAESAPAPAMNSARLLATYTRRLQMQLLERRLASVE